MTQGWAPNINWLAPDLAVGGSFPCGQAARIASEHKIGVIVDLRDEACDDRDELAACGVEFLHLPTPDMMAVSQDDLDKGVALAASARHRELKTLIHCEHGIGRSALLALCVLVDRGMEPLAALTRAKDARERVSPSEEQFRAWTLWMGRRTGHRPPSFEAFCRIAYRHLAQSA